jgi:hypothetical protein
MMSRSSTTQLNDVRRETAGMMRPEIIGEFPVGILLPCSRYFPCFPAGSDDFPTSFLKDPVAGTIELRSVYFPYQSNTVIKKLNIKAVSLYRVHDILIIYAQ